MGRAIKAGRVWTNCYHQYPAHAAFSGYKSSGVGRENHRMMLEHYTQTKCLLAATTRTRWGSSRPVTGAVTATPEARKVIRRLEVAHGPLMFFQSGGCCDGSSPMCLQKGELPVGASDLRLGEIGGAPFYIDAEQYERWRRPAFLIDVRPGEAGGFSLEGLEGLNFVTRAGAVTSCASRGSR